MKTKLMVVSSTLLQGVKKPKILLTGDQLNQLGFSHSMIVRATCIGDTITLKPEGKGINLYTNLVRDVRKKRDHLIQTIDKSNHKKLYSHLELSGDWFSQQGFSIGDVVAIDFKPSCIGIRRLPIEKPFLTVKTRVLMAHSARNTDGRLIPQIRLLGRWLADAHFQVGQHVRISYDHDAITLTLDTNLDDLPRPKCGQSNTRPDQVTILENPTHQNPYITLGGFWLEDCGFFAGDHLVIHYQKNWIRITRIDSY